MRCTPRVSDSGDGVQNAEEMSDEAKVTPGYLVTSPAAYSEVFLLEPLPDDAKTLILDFRYELLVTESRSTPRELRQADGDRPGGAQPLSLASSAACRLLSAYGRVRASSVARPRLRVSLPAFSTPQPARAA